MKLPLTTVRELQEQLMAERDITGFAVLSALHQVERHAHARGWGQPGQLFTIYRELLKPGAVENIDGFMLAISEVGNYLLRDQDGDQITSRLHRLANSTLLKAMVPENILGFALVSEAWARMTTAGEDLHSGGPISEHPDRIEIRNVVAVDTAGITYQLIRTRGEDTVYAMRGGSGDPLHLGGQITEGLRELMEACA